jgi:hypothetical protein
MTRSDFLKTALSLPALAARPLPAQAGVSDFRSALASPTGATIANQAFELSLAMRPALEVRLVHKPSGLILAGAPYSYSFGAPRFEHASSTREGDATLVELEGLSGPIAIRQRYRIPDHAAWIEETLTLSNQGRYAVALPDARCGFVLPLAVEGDQVTGPLARFRFTAVPYRREPRGNTHQYADYSVGDVLTKPRVSALRNTLRIDRGPTVVTSVLHSTGVITTEYSAYASEAWVLTDGSSGFVISKYNQDGMEWSVVDRVPVDAQHAGLRWGGLAIFEGDPEHGALIAPGESFRFGTTRITAYAGGINEGFYAFRSEMEDRGQGCPAGFSPPVHWNELYDNKLWWLPANGQDNPDNRRKYYALADMKTEAAKARDYHCEALYLDPGWDTSFASKIWDEPRLGKLADFTAMMRRDYGLSVSLHTPMAGWCNPSSYGRSIDRMLSDGSRVDRSLCGMSHQYVEETFRRLDALAGAGVRFFMFDGTIYAGPCWDRSHGHAVPARRDEHARAMNRLARMVHRKHPQVLIEMHDQLLGGTTLRHVPTYYGYGESPDGRGFDTVWAFELMWDPMTDLAGGHSIALYYYNLAYSLPLYIHIDLRTDNEQALMLWWNASTCRHLGLGGTHKDGRTAQAHRDALAVYRRLKPFFTAGVFYGIDEQTHVHRHPAEPRAVVNCFNLTRDAVRRSFTFAPARYGLDPSRRYRVTGGSQRPGAGGDFDVEVATAPWGHTLVEIESGV